MNTYNIDDNVFFIDFTVQGGKLRNDIILLIKKVNNEIWYELVSGTVVKQSAVICKFENKEYALQYFTIAVNSRLQETTEYINSL